MAIPKYFTLRHHKKCRRIPYGASASAIAHSLANLASGDRQPPILHWLIEQLPRETA